MHIKYIGHSYHKKTQSTGFFIELLRRLGKVDLAWDESWKPDGPGVDLSEIHKYDLVVIFQTERAALQAARLKLNNVVFVPMYDGVKHLTTSEWRRLLGLKVLCFSSFLHEKLQRVGHRKSAYFQYFVNPALLPEAKDFSGLKAFFWQRRKEISLRDVLKLLGSQKVDSLHLHCAIDPDQGEVILPSKQETRTYRIRTSEWFERREELYEAMARSNTYFAPRLDEGIGLSFIEAMAMGMVVVAPSAPTMNEYIVDGINGFLYNAPEMQTVSLGDLERLNAIGGRAREGAFAGYERWQKDVDRLLDFCATPSSEAEASRFRFARAPERLIGVSTWERATGRLPAVGGKRSSGTDANKPLVTVATVVRDARDDLLLTLSSVLQQDIRGMEIVVIDGGSSDGTREVLSALSGVIDYWESAEDRGPYDGMNKAATVARGEWIIFMNGGDYFCSASSLRQLLGSPSIGDDFVVGHHIYLSTDGVEEIHRVRDFEKTWSALQAGKFPNDWLTGVPGHQVTLVRARLLKKHRFDLNFRIAADHDFMYRMRAMGSRFRISDVIAAQYRGGGLSWKHQMRCCQEWLRTCKAHSKNQRGVDAFFVPMLIRSLRFGGGLRGSRELMSVVRSHPWSVIRFGLEIGLKRLRRVFEVIRRRGIFLDLRFDDKEGVLGEIHGFSGSEGWGRWTDGEVASVETKRPVKGAVVVTIDCPNVFKPSLLGGAFVRIGEASVALDPKWSGGIAQVKLKVPTAASIVELVVSTPVSPLDLGWSSDYRKLGLGVRSIGIKQVRV